jgi:hypothetical protein
MGNVFSTNRGRVLAAVVLLVAYWNFKRRAGKSTANAPAVTGRVRLRMEPDQAADDDLFTTHGPSSYKCLVESDLLESKHKCTITAPSTLDGFMEALVSSLGMKLPKELTSVQQLLFEVYDKDFEDFVGEWLFWPVCFD